VKRSYLLLLLLLVSGCNLLGAAFSKVVPDSVEAEYIPEKEPMAVVVENFNQGTGEFEGDQIALYIGEELTRNKIAPVVDATKVYDLRAADPAKFRTLSLATIGRNVGAKQVLYVDLMDSAVGGPIASNSMKGTISARVKIIDTATGKSRWPQDAEAGFPISLETAFYEKRTEVNEASVREQLHRKAADVIAKLFYKYDKD